MTTFWDRVDDSPAVLSWRRAFDAAAADLWPVLTAADDDTPRVSPDGSDWDLGLLLGQEVSVEAMDSTMGELDLLIADLPIVSRHRAYRDLFDLAHSRETTRGFVLMWQILADSDIDPLIEVPPRLVIDTGTSDTGVAENDYFRELGFRGVPSRLHQGPPLLAVLNFAIWMTPRYHDHWNVQRRVDPTGFANLLTVS